MKLRLICLGLACTLLLGGCSLPHGSYHSVTPHQDYSGAVRTENLTVSNYEELVSAMETVVEKGTENAILNAVDYDIGELEQDLAAASRHIRLVYPVGAYALERLHYEVGSNSGKIPIALTMTYRHSRTEIRKIRKAKDAEEIKRLIGEALVDFDTELVIQMEMYTPMDVVQIVQDYALNNPAYVMEIPQVVSEVHGISTSRVLELTFTYQTSRDALRLMQSQVDPMFDAAVLYVSGEGTESQKFAQLYAFLMERFDYKVETSITPSYSLLRHGVGDSRAFATVYAAMCRAADLECIYVTGTRSGEPWHWNIICQDGEYRHVDLLRCSETGGFRGLLDSQMNGYVWDYSAYPQCISAEGETEEAENKDLTNTENVV